MANSNLINARMAKKDEFYTQWEDVQKEMSAYLDYNPNVFKNKTILLPCDDPEWSNFTRFFAQNFERYELKKLISTSYAADSKNYTSNYEPTSFEINDPKYDKTKTTKNGKIFILDRDMTNDGKIDIDDLKWQYLNGDGDFRSDEIKALRDESDIIITNPPFSLFKVFLPWIMESNKQFAIIGNLNSIGLKEVFPLIKDNKLWLGPSISSGDREFQVPDDYPLNAAGWRIDADGKKFLRVKGVRWYTNIDHGRRHQPLKLMSMKDNLRFNKKVMTEIERGKQPYVKYDNYDAIEVPFTNAIPNDYDGVIGVPITFIDKYNPEQFEIIGGDSYSETPPTKTYPKKSKVKDGKQMKSKTGTMGCVIREEEFGNGTYFDVGYPVRAVYIRIFIKHIKEI